MNPDFKEACFQWREYLKAAEAMIEMVGQTGVGEADANIMLAFRHLEDCRMRLGKAVQALNGGTSCYPR